MTSPPRANSSVDVAIIGLGSAGEALAGALVDAGLDVVGFETSLVGGECPFLACMPSKAMLHDGHDASRRAVPNNERRALWQQAVVRRDGVAEHRDDAAHAQDLTDRGLTLIRERASLIGPNLVEAAGKRWSAKHVVVATGSTAVIPPIDGLDPEAIWTSDDAMTTSELPERIFILGAGAIGCELSDVYTSFGSQVIVADATDRLLEGFDADVAERYGALLAERGIDIRLGTSAERMDHRGDETVVTLSDGSTITADRVIIAVGQRPRLSGLGLDALCVPDGSPTLDSRHRVDGHPWLFVIGDANGVDPWTHGANREAKMLADELLGRPWALSTAAMPRCIFTDPPASHVGESVASMRNANRQALRGSASYGDIARLTTDGLSDGEVAVVIDADSGRIVGASVAGSAADELIALATAWVHLDAHIDDVRRQVFAFPTIAQVLEVAVAKAAEEWDKLTLRRQQ